MCTIYLLSLCILEKILLHLRRESNQKLDNESIFFIQSDQVSDRPIDSVVQISAESIFFFFFEFVDEVTNIFETHIGLLGLGFEPR
jgi:hypothetical protein